MMANDWPEGHDDDDAEGRSHRANNKNTCARLKQWPMAEANCRHKLQAECRDIAAFRRAG